jgi:hypothetical protein
MLLFDSGNHEVGDWVSSIGITFLQFFSEIGQMVQKWKGGHNNGELISLHFS